jgi:hypothetical protein
MNDESSTHHCFPFTHRPVSFWVVFAGQMQARVNVVALMPPNQGIRATLGNHGVSRVVVQTKLLDFQLRSFSEIRNWRRSARRTTPPVSFELSSPGSQLTSAQTGVQSAFLLPFENLGVDASWEFIMPAQRTRSTTVRFSTS